MRQHVLPHVPWHSSNSHIDYVLATQDATDGPTDQPTNLKRAIVGIRINIVSKTRKEKKIAKNGNKKRNETRKNEEEYTENVPSECRFCFAFAFLC